jgi:transposase-like protein
MDTARPTQAGSGSASCPGCRSAAVTKTGHPDHLGLDTYRCADCGMQFTVETPKPRP